MSLLLPSAKSGVLVTESKKAERFRIAMIAIGFFVVIVGAANITARLATAAYGDRAAFIAFGPAIASLPSYTSGNLLNTFAATTSNTSTDGSIVPTRLTIPAIGVDATVEHVGKKADGSLGTPSSFGDVAWYQLGQKPGAPGTAIIDGHVNNALTTAGVFEHLAQLRLGDTVFVADGSGKSLMFVVKKIQEYTPDASTSAIFSASGPAQIALITCDGDWVQTAHSFNKRLVVFAELK